MGLYKSPVKYNDANIKKALKYAKNMNADMGGTKLYDCLNDCINEKMESYIESQWLSDTKSNNTYENIIIVLTDGQINSMAWFDKKSNKYLYLLFFIGCSKSHVDEI